MHSDNDHKDHGSGVPDLSPHQYTRRRALAFGAAAAGALLLPDVIDPASARAAIAWYYPFTTPYPVNSYFGEFDPPYWESTHNYHRGADIGAPYDEVIRAMASGTISYGVGDGWGNYARIDHGLSGGRRYYSLYAHHQGVQLASGSVNAGQAIARVGTSGGVPPHLHIEITVDGVTDAYRQDPFLFIPSSPNGQLPSLGSNDEENTMIYKAVTTSSNGWIGVGSIFIQNADGPLRGLTGDEWGAHASSGAFVAEWPGNNINSLIARVGLRKVESNGRIGTTLIYGP